jgi:hypothetical protein
MKVLDRPEAQIGYTRAKLEILCCLMERADQPVELAELSRLIDLPLEQIETELDELEGPIGGTHGMANSYVHRARCSMKAIYIS